MHKEVKEIIRMMKAQGWTVEVGKTHVKLVPADKTQPKVTIANTPSDNRWKKNTLAQIRRCGGDVSTMDRATKPKAKRTEKQPDTDEEGK